jgi:hypothetical protein
MANVAYNTWNGFENEGPRWDDVSPSDHDHVASLAKDHADTLRGYVSGRENALDDQKPHQRAMIRDSYAPMYYDFHRSTLASDPSRVPTHIRTSKLAAQLALQQPPDLGTALNTLADVGTPDDIRQQYLLWKHSLWLSNRPKTWTPSGVAAAGRAGLDIRAGDPKDALAVDDALRGTFGDHTRSPQMARLAFAFAHPNGPLRGTTIYPSGDMIVGTLPGGDEKTRHDNRKTIVEEMAHSLLMRHYKNEAKAYNEWIRSRTADHADRNAHLPAGMRHMGLPQRNDYTEALAHTLAHGVFDQPGMPPWDDEAPNDESVAFGGRLFRKHPVRSPSHFRSMPI